MVATLGWLWGRRRLRLEVTAYFFGSEAGIESQIILYSCARPHQFVDRLPGFYLYLEGWGGGGGWGGGSFSNCRSKIYL